MDQPLGGHTFDVHPSHKDNQQLYKMMVGGARQKNLASSYLRGIDN